MDGLLAMSEFILTSRHFDISLYKLRKFYDVNSVFTLGHMSLHIWSDMCPSVQIALTDLMPSHLITSELN